MTPATEKTEVNSAQEEPKKPLRACCACPDTRKARDECIILNGEERCGPLIEAHKKCLRQLGFQI